MTTEQTWNTFSDYLKNFIASKIKDASAVDDILQEVFVKIHTNIQKVKDDEKLESWVFQIARNVINDYFRKSEKDLKATIGNTPLLNEESDSHEAQDCIEPLINKLEPKYRDVLLLSEIKGLKHQQVADEIGISLPAVKSRVLRGRELLKSGFMACCDYKLNKQGKLIGEHKTNSEDCKVCN